jgi:hypothetical protein
MAGLYVVLRADVWLSQVTYIHYIYGTPSSCRAHHSTKPNDYLLLSMLHFQRRYSCTALARAKSCWIPEHLLDSPTNTALYA